MDPIDAKKLTKAAIADARNRSKKPNISQVALAAEFNVTASMMSQYLRDSDPPAMSLQTFEFYARRHGMTLGELMNELLSQMGPSRRVLSQIEMICSEIYKKFLDGETDVNLNPLGAFNLGRCYSKLLREFLSLLVDSGLSPFAVALAWREGERNYLTCERGPQWSQATGQSTLDLVHVNFPRDWHDAIAKTWIDQTWPRTMRDAFVMQPVREGPTRNQEAYFWQCFTGMSKAPMSVFYKVFSVGVHRACEESGFSDMTLMIVLPAQCAELPDATKEAALFLADFLRTVRMRDIEIRSTALETIFDFSPSAADLQPSDRYYSQNAAALGQLEALVQDYLQKLTSSLKRESRWIHSADLWIHDWAPAGWVALSDKFHHVPANTRFDEFVKDDGQKTTYGEAYEEAFKNLLKPRNEKSKSNIVLKVRRPICFEPTMAGPIADLLGLSNLFLESTVIGLPVKIWDRINVRHLYGVCYLRCEKGIAGHSADLVAYALDVAAEEKFKDLEIWIETSPGGRTGNFSIQFINYNEKSKSADDLVLPGSIANP